MLLIPFLNIKFISGMIFQHFFQMLNFHHRPDSLVVFFCGKIFTPLLNTCGNIFVVNPMMDREFCLVLVRCHIIKETGLHIQNSKKIVPVIHNCFYNALTDMTPVHIMNIE